MADASGARFAAGPTARLEELHARAALDLIEAGLALGEIDSLIGELRAMIAADPVAERPRGLLMRALYAAGRQAEALAVYTQTRELLASELGADPSPQLEQIYVGVLRQDLQGGPRGLPPLAGRAHGGPGEYSSEAERLPRGDPQSLRMTGVRKPLTSFVGRDADVARVLKMLADGRLVTLTGPGGAGKTRLAIETAARLAADSPVGTAGAAAAPGRAQAREGRRVWLIELAPVTDPGEVPYAVLHALGIRESSVIAHAGGGQLGRGADPVQRLVAVLAERRDLLILDNCEHVVAAAAALADQVLAGCPRVRVLVTSREPLRITGEALWPVPPLPVPPALAPGREVPDGIAPADGTVPDESACDTGRQVAGYASVRLLADRAAAVRPDFRVDASNATDVARICAHWTACRWPSNWPPPGCTRFRPLSSRSGWTPGSSCSPAAAGRRCHGTRPFARSWTGAGNCCPGPSRCSPGGWPLASIAFVMFPLFCRVTVIVGHVTDRTRTSGCQLAVRHVTRRTRLLTDRWLGPTGAQRSNILGEYGSGVADQPPD